MILEFLIPILTTAPLLAQEVSRLCGINSAISRKSFFGFGRESAWNIDFVYVKSFTVW
jgi:hypothetical protein